VDREFGRDPQTEVYSAHLDLLYDFGKSLAFTSYPSLSKHGELSYLLLLYQSFISEKESGESLEKIMSSLRPSRGRLILPKADTLAGLGKATESISREAHSAAASIKTP